MKIQLFFIDYSHKNSSGLSTYVRQLTDCFSKQSEISLGYININAKMRTEVEREVIGDVVNYHYPSELQVSNTELNSSLVDILESNIVTDLPVIFHFNWINHAPFAQILKQNFDCITVLTKHCIPWRDHIVGNYNLFNRLNTYFLSKYENHFIDQALHREYIAYTSVDHIICVTEFAKRSVVKMFNLPEENTSVVYNGLNTSGFASKSKDDLRINYGFTISDKIILFAGNVNTRKGVVDLVESMKLLLDRDPNFRLVIAGKGDYASIVNAAQKKWSKITITGNLDKETLQDFYQLADVGVVPSYIEQCSYTAIEMMHAGLPIVVADVDGLSEIVPVDGGYKVPLQLDEQRAKIDVLELSNSIEMLINNPEESYRLANKAKAHAQEKFDSEAMSTETIKVYQKLIDGSYDGKDQITKGTANISEVSIIVNLDGELEDHLKVFDNILEQNYMNIEIYCLISEIKFDEFVPRFESFKDKISFVRVPKRQSIVKYLNQIIQTCESEFVTVISKKVIISKDRFHRQAETLLSDIDLDFVGSHLFTLDDAGQRNGIVQFAVHSEDSRVLNLFQTSGELAGTLFRTSFLKKMKFKSFAYRIDESKFWFEVFRGYKGRHLNEYLTSIYINNNYKKPVKSNDTVRNHIAEILQDQLEYYKIEYDAKELALHLAIYFRYRKLYFNNDTKNNHLTQWLAKLLPNLGVTDAVDNIRFTSHVKQYLCDVY